MSLDLHERATRAVAAHFAATGHPDDERDMRAHIIDCAGCRGVYDQHLLLATLDPRAPTAQERLGRRLGFRPAPRPRARLAFGAGFLGLATAAAVMLLVLRPSPPPPPSPSPSSIGIRGITTAPVTPAAELPELRVFRIPPGEGPRPAGSTVRAADELAFAYRNPAGKRHLLVFAVDEHGHVYWYHPEWSRAEDNPAGVPISKEPGLHELPAAVVQHFDGERLTIHALFTNRPLTVRQVEAAFAAPADRGSARASAFADAIDVAYPLRVMR